MTNQNLSEPLLDLQLFEQAKTTMQHKFPKIIGYFIEDCESYLATIQQGLAQQHASLIAPAAHTIKSSSRQLGAIQLSSLAALLEQQARDYLRAGTGLSEMQSIAARMREAFLLTCVEMKGLMG